MSEHSTERQIPLILIGVGLLLYAIAAFVHAGTAGVAPDRGQGNGAVLT